MIISIINSMTRFSLYIHKRFIFATFARFQRIITTQNIHDRRLSLTLTIFVGPAFDLCFSPAAFACESADQYPVLRKLTKFPQVNSQGSVIHGLHGNASLCHANFLISHMITQKHAVNMVIGYRFPKNPDTSGARVERGHVRRR